jgi:hypothetical protein
MHKVPTMKRPDFIGMKRFEFGDVLKIGKCFSFQVLRVSCVI